VGWNTSGSVSAYKFALGDSANYFKWDGNNFIAKFTEPLKLIPSGTGTVFYIEHPTVPTRVVDIGAYWSPDGTDWLTSSRLSGTYGSFINLESDVFVAKQSIGSFTAMRFEGSSYGNTFRIAGSRTPPSRTSTGNVGEICWNGTYLYICTATNFWSKILLEPL